MLINCVAYQKGRRLADLDVAEISDYLAKPGVFVWVALRDATAEELETMRQEFLLHELAIEDAAKGHQRPKIEEYGASLFVVMQLVELVGGEPKVGEIAIFAGSNPSQRTSRSMASTYSTSSLVGLVSSKRRLQLPRYSWATPKSTQIALAWPMCR